MHSRSRKSVENSPSGAGFKIVIFLFFLKNNVFRLILPDFRDVVLSYPLYDINLLKSYHIHSRSRKSDKKWRNYETSKIESRRAILPNMSCVRIYTYTISTQPRTLNRIVTTCQNATSYHSRWSNSDANSPSSDINVFGAFLTVLDNNTFLGKCTQFFEAQLWDVDRKVSSIKKYIS
jgi:hypothetical protein